jgi:hypothetical protein
LENTPRESMRKKKLHIKNLSVYMENARKESMCIQSIGGKNLCINGECTRLSDISELGQQSSSKISKSCDNI